MKLQDILSEEQIWEFYDEVYIYEPEHFSLDDALSDSMYEDYTGTELKVPLSNKEKIESYNKLFLSAFASIVWMVIIKSVFSRTY